MKKYKNALAFYAKLSQIIDFVEEDLPHEVGMDAIDLFSKAKDEISITEFTAKEVIDLHEDFDVREFYSEAAFRDLAPFLRNPEVQALVENLATISGTIMDDLYMQVRNVRLLGDDTNGPAVVTLVVHSYDNFRGILHMEERYHPEVIHGSISERARSIE